MKPIDIKVGRTYTGDHPAEERTVIAIGLQERPGTALITGVTFEVDGVRDSRYIDTFAKWAKKVVHEEKQDTETQ